MNKTECDKKIVGIGTVTMTDCTNDYTWTCEFADITDPPLHERVIIDEWPIPRTLLTNCVKVSAKEFIDYLYNIGFFGAPASATYHGAYAGGLFCHSFRVAETLMDLTKKLDLKWERPESPYIVGMFHDICKADEYERCMGKDENGNYRKFKKKDPKTLPLIGHGDKSIKLLEGYIDLTDEEKACIRYHMGAFYPNEMNEYGNAIEHYENVLWTHTADIYATRVMGV